MGVITLLVPPNSRSSPYPPFFYFVIIKTVILSPSYIKRFFNPRPQTIYSTNSLLTLCLFFFFFLSGRTGGFLVLTPPPYPPPLFAIPRASLSTSLFHFSYIPFGALALALALVLGFALNRKISLSNHLRRRLRTFGYLPSGSKLVGETTWIKKIFLYVIYNIYKRDEKNHDRFSWAWALEDLGRCILNL